MKHPEASPKFDSLLLHYSINEIHETVFDEIAKDLIQKTAILTKGAAGPSKFDAEDWQRILGSNVFGNQKLGLRRSLARVIKKLSAHKVSCHENLEALFDSQLIPLNKPPGVRPIGIGEVLRRFIGKVVISVAVKEVVQAAVALNIEVIKTISSLFILFLSLTERFRAIKNTSQAKIN